jgi:hypothetical protein
MDLDRLLRLFLTLVRRLQASVDIESKERSVKAVLAGFFLAMTIS